MRETIGRQPGYQKVLKEFSEELQSLASDRCSNQREDIMAFESFMSRRHNVVKLVHVLQQWEQSQDFLKRMKKFLEATP